MIRMTETQLTVKMSLPEAKALHNLLRSLPNTRNDTRLYGEDFNDEEWQAFMDFFKALDAELK